MAGHSKWAQIKRKKAVTDSRRGKLWTKILKEITVSARLGGGDPSGNPRLRSAVQEAKSANVPNDNIDRAIKRGTGQLDGVSYEELTYEGYGPGGVAVLVEAMTDNKNRTVSEVRHLFARFGGNLGENGCVAWMFDKRGVIEVAKEAVAEDALMEAALELGADDLSTDGEAFEMLTSPEAYEAVQEGLEARDIPILSRSLAMIPQTLSEVSIEDTPQVVRLLEALEDNDDVQNVWSNADLDDDALPETE